MDSVQDADTVLGLQRGQNTPGDQHRHQREGDPNRKFRPQLTAKYDCLETEGSRKRYRAIGRRR